MDENRKIHEKRHVKIPKSYYAAQVDAHGQEWDEDNERTDFRIRGKRDIDSKNLFVKTRIFQNLNIGNNLANLFHMDFGSA